MSPSDRHTPPGSPGQGSRCVAAALGLGLCLLSFPACEGIPVCVPGDNCPWITTDVPLTVGGSQACWIKADGSLWCWGDNGTGQLALGAADLGESVPARVGTDTDWALISAGAGHTCGIRQDGTLWCWGDNYVAESNPLGGQSAPIVTVHAVGSAHWTAISCGVDFTCGIQADGSLWCWGEDDQGQAGPQLSASDPSTGGGVQELPGGPWLSVADGDFHACAVRHDTSLWCWGDNERGQLGDGGQDSGGGPLQVWPPIGWTLVSSGRSHSCGLRSDGSLWCWGDNGHGQLGVPAPTASPPVQVPMPASGGHWAAVSAGGDSTCATGSDGRLWCWGENGEGKLGLGTTTDAAQPTQVGTDATWRISAVGEQSTCATRTDGSVWCWGFDGEGQVGDDDPQGKATPMALAPGMKWSAISGGDAATCGVPIDGTLWCAGYPAVTYLGTPYTSAVSNSPVFARIGNASDWTTVSVGETHACAAASDGSLWCWGANYSGELGTGDESGSTAPRPVGTDRDWIGAGGLAAAAEFTCALKQDQSLWCWGNNVDIPVATGSARWTQICASGSDACGLQTDGTIWCWGNGNAAPSQLSGSDDWTQISCGSQTALVALKNDGTVWKAKLLDDTLVPDDAPQPFASLSTGEDQICGVTAAGDLFCSGGNDDGDVGNGQVDKTAPWTPLGSGFALSVAGIDSSTFALKQDGSLWGWGSNEAAQLGLPGDIHSTPFMLPK